MKQIQFNVNSIENGYLVASPKTADQKELSRMSPEERQQFLQTPNVEFCEDYEAVCNHIKRFFFVVE